MATPINSGHEMRYSDWWKDLALACRPSPFKKVSILFDPCDDMDKAMNTKND